MTDRVSSRWIEATTPQLITSVRFEAVDGDAISYDHVAWLAPTPVPTGSPTYLLLVLVATGLVWRRSVRQQGGAPGLRVRHHPLDT